MKARCLISAMPVEMSYRILMRPCTWDDATIVSFPVPRNLGMDVADTMTMTRVEHRGVGI